MSRAADAFRQGYGAAMADNARADVELYSLPEAVASPLVAWAMLPHGFNREAFRRAVTEAPRARISAEEAARAHARNLAILKQKVAFQTLIAHEEIHAH